MDTPDLTDVADEGEEGLNGAVLAHLGILFAKPGFAIG